MSPLWSSADIHIHTTASDGYSTAGEVLQAAHDAGLRVIAITDHDTIEAALEAQRLAPAYRVEVIVGEEVSTAEGHLLALWIERRIPPGRPLTETIAAVHAQGGLCVLAHPFGWLVSSVGPRCRERCGSDWPVAGIETFNASLPWPMANRRAARCATRLGLAALGGSDAHHAATVGSGITRFEGTSAANLRTAILARRTVAAGRGWGVSATTDHLARQVQHTLGTMLRPRGAASSPH
jgi:predicted metal-dependent phosphoesterase TrpH